MAQRVRLDRLRGQLYLALVFVGACHPTLPPVVPEQAQEGPTDSVAEWTGTTAPGGRGRHRLRCLYHDGRSGVGGRGSARVAAPDSLRFDVAGPLGANPAAAMVVEDSAVWIDAPESIRDIVPSYPLLWAGFGVVHPPAGAEVLSAGRAGAAVVWREVAGSDTLDFAWTRTGERRLIAEVRRGGAVV